MPASNAIPVRAVFAPSQGAASFYVRFGDLNNPLVATLYNAAGTVCDLTTANSVVFEFIPGGIDPVVLERTGAVAATPTTGEVSYTFVVDDFDGSYFGYGRYNFIIKVGFADGSTYQIPASKYYTMEVRPAAGLTSPASLNRKPTLAVAEVSRYYLSAAQTTGLSLNSKVLFDRRVSIQDQSIVTLQGNSQIKVKKGFRARFEFTPAVTFSAASGSVSFGVWDATNSVLVWQSSPLIRPQTDTNQVGTSGELVAYVEPDVDTLYEIRITSVTALQSIDTATQLLVTIVNKTSNLTLTHHYRTYLGVAANQAAMLALVAKPGDWCERTDDPNKAYELIAEPYTSASNWKVFPYPATGGGGGGAAITVSRQVYDGATPLTLSPTPSAIVAVFRGPVFCDKDSDYTLVGATLTPTVGGGWIANDVIHVIYTV